MHGTTEYKKGDWVQFYSAGHLVIDEVQGTTSKTGGFRYVRTMHHCEVAYSSIVAVRSAGE